MKIRGCLSNLKGHWEVNEYNKMNIKTKENREYVQERTELAVHLALRNGESSFDCWWFLFPQGLVNNGSNPWTLWGCLYLTISFHLYLIWSDWVLLTEWRKMKYKHPECTDGKSKQHNGVGVTSEHWQPYAALATGILPSKLHFGWANFSDTECFIYFMHS